MELYELYQFLHISAAIIWVGGGILGLIFSERAKRADPVHRLGIARDMEVVGSRVFAPAAISTLVFGVLMVIDLDGLAFSQPWITIGFTAVALSIVLGAGYLGPQSAKFVAELEADDPTAMERLKRITIGSYVDTGILLIAVWAMVAKPI